MRQVVADSSHFAWRTEQIHGYSSAFLFSSILFRWCGRIALEIKQIFPLMRSVYALSHIKSRTEIIRPVSAMSLWLFPSNYEDNVHRRASRGDNGSLLIAIEFESIVSKYNFLCGRQSISTNPEQSPAQPQKLWLFELGLLWNKHWCITSTSVCTWSQELSPNDHPGMDPETQKIWIYYLRKKPASVSGGGL